MKKIFVLTGEPSGDKLASKVIVKLKSGRSDIEYLSVGDEHLKALGVNSLYDLKEVTYLGFTKVLLNIFQIKRKINETVKEIIKFKPDILFSVDSPDFTLRVAKEVKRIDPNIKTIHYVAPQVWIWRERRVKKLKNFLDHVLLLFPFEKKYFEKENINCTFVGHPLLEDDFKKIDLKHLNIKEKKIISIFPGSRLSEINKLMPILIDFIELSKDKKKDFIFIFHATKYFENLIKKFLLKTKVSNYIVVSDESIKRNVLKESSFAISKSGTISLEICKAGVPSIIIYKMNFINFFIVRLLVKVKFANIINIINDSEIIPELLQNKCNANKINEMFNLFINDINLCKKQVDSCQKTLEKIKTNISASENVSDILRDNL